MAAAAVAVAVEMTAKRIGSAKGNKKSPVKWEIFYCGDKMAGISREMHYSLFSISTPFSSKAAISSGNFSAVVLDMIRVFRLFI